MDSSAFAPSCAHLISALERILGGGRFSLCLYGSSVLDDFVLGISDIDILVLTDAPLTKEQGDTLVTLRQTLFQETGDEGCLLFEGAILSSAAFFDMSETLAVYWGTEKERFTIVYKLDPFSRFVIKKYGRMLYGEDFRGAIALPTFEELKNEIARHLKAIRTYAQTPKGNIHSIGWLFDIARGLYTLRTGDVASKRAAAEWALQNGLVPDPAVMQTVLRLRENPSLFGTPPFTAEWASSLGPAIQTFANVLERELSL